MMWKMWKKRLSSTMMGILIWMLFCTCVYSQESPIFYFYTDATTPLLQIANNQTSLDEAVRQIRKETRGKILSAKEQQQGELTIYVIKVLLPDGKVKVFEVNANQ